MRKMNQAEPGRVKTQVAKIVSSTILASILTACGGGGGGSDDAGTNPAVDANAAKVAGYVMKGVVTHGVVSAYAVVNGQKGELLANGLTDENGFYSLAIPSTYNGPVKLEVRAGSDSSMICDAADGCGDAASIPSYDTNRNGQIDFGEAFPLDTEFALDAAIPAVSGGSTISAAVTSITHLASAYAEHFPEGLSAESIAQANSQAANIFAVNGNILSLTPPNLADSAAVAKAESASVYYAIMSAAVLGTVDRDNLGSQLNALAQTFAGLNGQLYQNHALDNSVAFDDIAEQAFLLADKLELTESRSKSARLLQIARTSTVSSLTQAQSSPTSSAAPVDQAKQFVADINSWNGMLNFKNSEGLFAEHHTQMQQNLLPVLAPMQQTLAGVAAWGLVPVLPELVVATYCNSLMGLAKTLCHSMISTDGLSRACVSGSGLTLFGHDACDLVKQIKLVKRSDYNVVYNLLEGTVSAKGTVNGQTVDLLMTANTADEGETLSLLIEGTVENASAKVNLQSSTISFNFADGINLLRLKAPGTANAEFIGSVVQKASETVTDPISFEGQMNLDVDLSNLANLNSSGDEQVVLNLSESLASRNLEFNLMLAGQFSAESGDSLQSTLTVHGGDTNTYSLSYEIDSPDLTTTALATVSGTIDQSVMKPVDIELYYAGRSILASNDENDLNRYSLLNQDGILIDVNLDPAATGSIGSATLAGATLAGISHQDASYLVEFADGSSTTLNLQ